MLFRLFHYLNLMRAQFLWESVLQLWFVDVKIASKRVNKRGYHLTSRFGTCFSQSECSSFPGTSVLYSPAMSISPALKAATRSAYRDVLRAASVTFTGLSSSTL